jgi:hypothetical protein
MTTPNNFQLTPNEIVQPDCPSPTAADRMRFVNYVHDETRRVGIDPVKIIERLLLATENWPCVVSGELYVLGDNNSLRPLTKPEELFAWLGLRFQVDWWQGTGAITKAEFFSALRMQCHSYHGREIYPHHPPVDRILYRPFEFQHANGLKLREFVDFFSPSSAEDRQLIIALILTVFWGGAGGQRPAFLVTSSDSGARQGRGSGKLVERLRFRRLFRLV